MADPDNDIPLDTWQTEEKTVATLVMDDDGDTKVSERVVEQRYMPTRLIPQTVCGEHHYDLVERGKRQNGQVLVKRW